MVSREVLIHGVVLLGIQVGLFLLRENLEANWKFFAFYAPFLAWNLVGGIGILKTIMEVPKTNQKDRAMSYSIASIGLSLAGLLLMGLSLQVNNVLFGAGTGMVIYSTVLSLVPLIYFIDKHSTDEHNASG